MPTARSMLSAHRRKFRDAYSLVEIVVVIGILAVLAILAYPAFQSATVTGQLAKSIGNVRTLQMGNQQYAYDHQGWYARVAGWGEDGSYLNSWYLDPEFMQYFGIPAKNPQWPQGMTSPRSGFWDADGKRIMARSYGYNSTGLHPPNTPWAIPGLRMQVRMQNITRPEKTLAWADAVDWLIHIDYANKYPVNPYQGDLPATAAYRQTEEYLSSAVAYRYGGKAAVSFFDGHAAALQRKDLVGNTELWNLNK